MSAKALHVVTSVVEAGTGVTLLWVPSFVVELLLGASPDTSAAVTLARVAGAALLTMGVMCWLVRDSEARSGSEGLVPAILGYNVMVAGLLAFAGLDAGLVGIALWPAVGLHVLLGIWCVVCLRGSRFESF